MGTRTRHRLTAKQVEAAQDGWYNDGGNLHLRVGNGGRNKKWVLRYARDHMVIEIGLGAVSQGVTLKQARELRDKHLEALARGFDPREEKAKQAAEAQGYLRRQAVEQRISGRKRLTRVEASSSVPSLSALRLRRRVAPRRRVKNVIERWSSTNTPSRSGLISSPSSPWIIIRRGEKPRRRKPGGARVEDLALVGLGEPGGLFERRDDDRRRFEDQPLRRPDCPVYKRTFEKRSGSRDHAPVETGEPQAVMEIGQEARDVRAVHDGNGTVKAAGAWICLAGFLVAQAVGCRLADDTSGVGEGRYNGAEGRPYAAFPDPPPGGLADPLHINVEQTEGRFGGDEDEIHLGSRRNVGGAMEVRELVGDDDADAVGQTLPQASDRVNLARAESVDELGEGGDVAKVDPERLALPVPMLHKELSLLTLPSTSSTCLVSGPPLFLKTVISAKDASRPLGVACWIPTPPQ